jgi:hypothetical protein
MLQQLVHANMTNQFILQPVAGGANRRLKDDVCSTPPRRSTRTTKVGEIRVRADARAGNGNSAKPKLKKLQDELLSASASQTNLGEDGDQTTAVSSFFTSNHASSITRRVPFWYSKAEQFLYLKFLMRNNFRLAFILYLSLSQKKKRCKASS